MRLAAARSRRDLARWPPACATRANNGRRCGCTSAVQSQIGTRRAGRARGRPHDAPDCPPRGSDCPLRAGPRAPGPAGDGAPPMAAAPTFLAAGFLVEVFLAASLSLKLALTCGGRAAPVGAWVLAGDLLLVAGPVLPAGPLLRPAPLPVRRIQASPRLGGNRPSPGRACWPSGTRKNPAPGAHLDELPLHRQPLAGRAHEALPLGRQLALVLVADDLLDRGQRGAPPLRQRPARQRRTVSPLPWAPRQEPRHSLHVCQGKHAAPVHAPSCRRGRSGRGAPLLRVDSPVSRTSFSWAIASTTILLNGG